MESPLAQLCMVTALAQLGTGAAQLDAECGAEEEVSTAQEAKAEEEERRAEGGMDEEGRLEEKRADEQGHTEGREVGGRVEEGTAEEGPADAPPGNTEGEALSLSTEDLQAHWATYSALETAFKRARAEETPGDVPIPGADGWLVRWKPRIRKVAVRSTTRLHPPACSHTECATSSCHPAGLRACTHAHAQACGRLPVLPPSHSSLSQHAWRL